MITALLVGVSSLAAQTATAERGHEPLDAIATAYVGKPATVECEDLKGSAAADLGTNTIYLDTLYCSPLRALIGKQHVAPVRQGVGLIALAHEGIHLRGTLDEAKTECLAFQQVDEVQLLFGLDPRSWWGRKTRSYAYRDHFQLIRSGKPALRIYRSPPGLCEQGGPWDLTPYDGLWP